MGDRARERDQPVEPLADFLHQREGRLHAGVPASARGDRDQTVGALLDRLVREAVVDHVVQRDPAPAAHRGEDLLARAQ